MDDRIGSVNTILLYEKDAYIKEFEATVTGCVKAESENKKKELYNIELDKTAFFPEGGGQSSDTGFIEDAAVSQVASQGGRVLHTCEKAFEKGTVVKCRIDFAKRYDRMQNHSAEHLLCGLIHNATGFDNVGFHLGDDETILDLNGPVSAELLSELELKANRIIYENVPITAAIYSGDQLKSIDYRSKLDITENVRIVTIEGYDKCACCAPHVRTTGEIGSIKVVDFAPHRGGTRIAIIAGERAFKDHVMLDESNRKIMALLSTKRQEGAKGTEQLLNRNLALNGELVSIKKELTSMVFDGVKKSLEGKTDEKPVLVFSENFDEIMMRNLINDTLKLTEAAVAGFMGNDEKGYRYIIGAHKEKGILYGGEYEGLPVFAKKFNESLSGRGGGSPMMIQGSVTGKRKDIEEFFG